MTTFSLSTWLNRLKSGRLPGFLCHSLTQHPNLSALARQSEAHPPRFVRESDVALGVPALVRTSGQSSVASSGSSCATALRVLSSGSANAQQGACRLSPLESVPDQIIP